MSFVVLLVLLLAAGVTSDEIEHKRRGLNEDDGTHFGHNHNFIEIKHRDLNGGEADFGQKTHKNHTHHHSRRIWDILQTTLTAERLFPIAEAKKKEYKKNYPFPHITLDGLFPDELFDALDTEIPDNPELESEGCVKGAADCFRAAVTKPGAGIPELNKNGFESHFKPATNALFGVLKSSEFITFLEKLSGVDNLIPDPHYFGSGIHQTLRDGFLGVHADFNHLVQYGMHRRVNVFLYINEDWSDDWGGHLELWSRDMKTCGARIRPGKNRFVVFSSTDFSYHGHPSPLACPKERSRRSLALYYYTSTRPNEECIAGNCFADHTTLFQNSKCGVCDTEMCQKGVPNTTHV